MTFKKIRSLHKDILLLTWTAWVSLLLFYLHRQSWRWSNLFLPGPISLEINLSNGECLKVGASLNTQWPPQVDTITLSFSRLRLCVGEGVKTNSEWTLFEWSHFVHGLQETFVYNNPTRKALLLWVFKNNGKARVLLCFCETTPRSANHLRKRA